MKEKADGMIRIYKTTRKRLKIRAVKAGKSIAQIVDELERVR